MRPFEVSDHVVLKQNLSLYGYVQSTSTSNDPHGFEDDLIVNHAKVGAKELDEYLVDGVPPGGYVFIHWANPASGSSLVHQNDLILIGRSFRLGETVRRDGDPLTGAVIDVLQSYILAPNFSNKARAEFNFPKHSTCTADCPSRLPQHLIHENPHSLLYDVAAREVQRAQDVVRDDYIISGNWIGLVDEVEYDVVVRLQNRTVVVVNDTNLHIPIPNYGEALVALPESDGFKRPDPIVATQGGGSAIPISTYPRPGQVVIIDRSQLRNGRWISGSYDLNSPAIGTVLDCRAHDVSVDWMSNSQAPDDLPEFETIPKYDIQVYENIRTFRDTASLRRKKDVIPYDAGKMPIKEHGHPSAKGGSADGAAPAGEAVHSGQELEIGTHVKFRDVSAAAVKYQGINGTTHGSFLRVSTDAYFGWDINEFEIVHTQQQATVLWQDGTITTTDSTSLTGFTLFEPEMAPTDIVLKREGMRQKPVNQKGRASGGVKSFNEMTFFERPHDLLPASVGVVQSVDPTERLAQVRWFKEPNVELRASGHVISTDTRFGPIGDQIEDVSLYEVMSFPSLQRQRGDMCVISGVGNVEFNKRQTLSIADSTRLTGDAAPSAATSSNASRWRRGSHRHSRASGNASSSNRHSSQKEPDWIGEIVAINLDGSITVRLGGTQPCRDVSVNPDSILAIIDDREHLEDFAEEQMMDIDSWMDSESEWSEEEPEPISEVVEYEGGERLDDDMGDENWESDEEEVFEDAEEDLPDADEDVQMSNDESQEPYLPLSPLVKPERPERSLRQLQAMLGSEAPAQFLVLDCEPPADQFGLHSYPVVQSSLKRIAKEHKILATSLPEGEIYVRTYESRLDLLRCLIIGPRDTPYENAPFLIDLHLPTNFPNEPPTAHFHSWTSGLGRINPNLYEEGKICLSLLGTWSGKAETEKWSDKATILQLLVSLQGLVLVSKPFYNEAGFEGYEDDMSYKREAEQYSEKAFVMARGFVKYALLRPPGGLEDILAWLYLSQDPTKNLLRAVIERGNRLMENSDRARSAEDDSLLDSAGEKGDATKVFLKPLSRGASVMLRRSIGELQAQLGQLSNGGRALEAAR